MTSKPKDNNSKETIHWRTPKVILNAVADYFNPDMEKQVRLNYIFDPFPFKYNLSKGASGFDLETWKDYCCAFYSNPPYDAESKKKAWRVSLESGLRGFHLLPITIQGGNLWDEIMQDKGKGAGFGIRIIILKGRVPFYGESIKTGQIINAPKEEKTMEHVYMGDSESMQYLESLKVYLSNKGFRAKTAQTHDFNLKLIGRKGNIKVSKKYITQSPTFNSMLVEVGTGQPFIFESTAWDWKNKPIPQIYSHKPANTNIVFIDSETGGLNHKKHSLLEMGFAIYSQGRIIASLGVKLKHKTYHVTAKALEVNGINLVQPDKVALPLDEAILKIHAFLQQHLPPNEKITLGGWHIDFDKKFMRKVINRLKKLGWKIRYRSVEVYTYVVDLVEQGLIPKERLDWRLEDWVRHFGLEEEGLHTAESDAILTSQVRNKFQELNNK